MLRAHNYPKGLLGSWLASLKVNNGGIELLYRLKRAKTSRISVKHPETVPSLEPASSFKNYATAIPG